MTATEVIDQIKALDPQERAKVLSLLLEIESTQRPAHLDDQSFEQAADRVLQQHAELLQKLAQ